MPAVGTLLVITFFITSSDSGSLVDDMVTSGGHPDPPTTQRVFWAISEGAVAGVLLYTGGLSALQTASITSGLPLTILLLFTCYGLAKAFRIDLAGGGQTSGDVSGQ
jgi:choline/glycine/proline betaine transport protein